MRFTTTIVVALQASTGLALSINPDFKKHIEGQDGQAKDLSVARKEYIHGYERLRAAVAHRLIKLCYYNCDAEEKDDEDESNPFKVKDHNSKEEADDEDDSYPSKNKEYRTQGKTKYVYDSTEAEAEEDDDKDGNDKEVKDEDDPKYKPYLKTPKTWKPKTWKPKSVKTTKEDDDEKGIDYKTIHRHRFDLIKPEAIKTRTKTPKFDLRKSSSYKTEEKSAGDQKRPVIIKLDPRPDSLKHNPAFLKHEPRDTHNKKEKKKTDPNAPLPRLNHTQLINIERIPMKYRKKAVKDMPLDDEFKKEYLQYPELDLGMVIKLNKLYALIYEDPEYDFILKELNKPNKRSVAPELTKEQLKTLGQTDKHMRHLIAKKLEFNEALGKEFVNAKTLTPELTKKLNKEWVRVQGDPKYEGIVRKVKVMFSKRSVAPELTREKLKWLGQTNEPMRKLIAKKLEFNEALTTEFVNAKTLTPELTEKLNKEWDRIQGDPKYDATIPKIKGEFSKRSAVELDEEQIDRLKGLDQGTRLMLARTLDLNEDDTHEFVNAKKFTPELNKKVNVEYARLQDDPKYEKLVDQIKIWVRPPVSPVMDPGRRKREAPLRLTKKWADDGSVNYPDPENCRRVVKRENAEDLKHNKKSKELKNDEKHKELKNDKKRKELKNDEKHKEFKDDLKDGVKAIAKDFHEQGEEDLEEYKDILKEFLKTQVEEFLDNDATNDSSKEQAEPSKDKKTSKTLKVADEELKKKIGKTKENGWCDEFIEDLSKTWDEPETEEAEEEDDEE